MTDGTHIWVAVKNQNRIARIDPSDLSTTHTVQRNTEYADIKRITHDGTHGYGVADTDRVTKFLLSDASYVATVTSSPNLNEPIGIVHNGTHIYVACHHYITKLLASNLSFVKKNAIGLSDIQEPTVHNGTRAYGMNLEGGDYYIVASLK